MSQSVQKAITIVVTTSYLVKSALKITGGFIMGIPVLIADGIHGLFDIIEHGFLVLGGYYARKQHRDKYPIDRQPLIDLLGLTIYAFLMLFALFIILTSIHMLTVAFYSIGWTQFVLPSWFPSVNVELFAINHAYFLPASLIMLFSYVISERVYRYEYKKAVEHRIREMKADAIELRTDGWLEFATGFTLLISWVLLWFLSGQIDETQLMQVSSIIMALILLAIGFYLIIVARPEFMESFNNLMNVSLERGKREQLQEEINKRLPDGCQLINPLVCYHRGDQLFVKGYISATPELMWSIDLIIRNAENLTKTFFSDTDLEVFAQYSPFFRLSREHAINDLNKVLSECLGLSIYRPVSSAFRALRTGEIEEAVNWIQENETTDIQENAFGNLILAECFLQQEGAFSSKISSQVNYLREYINNSTYNNLNGLIYSWLLIYSSTLRLRNREDDEKITSARNVVRHFLDNNKVHDYVNAEINFALGFSWERAMVYDLEKCRKYYLKAEEFYAKSGIRSEIDRLYNTWGHFETLNYSLGDAENHLLMAMEIRKQKQDNLGLSYTYGSLGDLYSKMGRFTLGIEYYQKDLSLLDKLNNTHQVPHVRIKMAEQILKTGLLNSDLGKVMQAIDLCEKAKNELSDSFFVLKALCKCYMGKIELDDTGREQALILERVEKYLEVMETKSSYERAFHERLTGRYFALLGNFSQASKHLNNSSEQFRIMKDPLYEFTLGIQSVTSQIESLKWALAHQSSNNEINGGPNWQSLNILRNHVSSAGGMLGSAKDRIVNYLDSIDEKKENKIAIRHLSQLIWFLEG